MEGPKKHRFLLSKAGLNIGDSDVGEGAAPEPEVSERSVVSRKELGRELRRQAYQRAKKARAEDPRHLAMKEVVKQRRRELYQQVKTRRKEREAEQKAKDKVVSATAQAEAKRQLAERVKSAIGRGPGAIGRGADAIGRGADATGRSADAIGRESEVGRALARDIERALQSADVQELMDRLRAESAELAAQHQGNGSSS
jgi:hypothetical protein